MENEIDDFEDEEEDLKEEPKEKVLKKKIVPEENTTKEPLERYTAFYQEPRMGIVDTITQEIVIEGLTDLNLAKLEALKLNKLDRIGIVTGVD